MSVGNMQMLLAELVHLRQRVERLETIENLNMAQVAAEYVLPNQAQATVLGRAAAAGTGAPSALTAAQLVAVVATADGTGTGLDADTVDGSHASSFAASSHTHGTSGIDDAAVTLAKLANQAQATVIGRAAAAGTGVPVALTAAQLITILLGADGTGSLLDADTVDGLHATEVAASRFGAESAGVLDWNDVTNTRPGTGVALLKGNEANGPGGEPYYHILNFEYATKTGAGNVTQIAIPYAQNTSAAFIRGRYLGTWGAWNKIWLESNDGSGSGLDADLLDGSHASSFAAASHTHGASGLDSNAVTTAKILDANVTTAKIADANVTTAKILDANVTTAKIADANVTYAKLPDQVQATVMGRAAAAGTGDTTALTAAQLITILLGADGTGSLLDADLLDGYEANALAILASANVFTATQRVPKLEIDNATSYIDTDTAGALSILGDIQSIADSATISLANFIGFLLIVDLTNGNVALFAVRGGVNATQEISDPSGIFSTVKDTATSFNVYYDAGYKLQNKRGSTKSVSLIRLGR